MTTVSSYDISLSVPLDSPLPGDVICAYPLPRDTPRCSIALDVRPLDQYVEAAHEQLRRLSVDICNASPDDSAAVSEQVSGLLTALAPVRVQAAELEPGTLAGLIRRIERCVLALSAKVMPALTAFTSTMCQWQLGTNLLAARTW